MIALKRLVFLLLSIHFTWATAYAADDFCFEKAGKLYGIPPRLLEAISWAESRHVPDALNLNSNGSMDFGHMQINSLWVSEIGDTYLELDDPCFCTQVAAYILSGCIEKYGCDSDALSCYNSGRPLNKLKGDLKKRVQKYVRMVESRYLKLKK
jgi:soluble lytic murein transglycosylase-like protein